MMILAVEIHVTCSFFRCCMLLLEDDEAKTLPNTPVNIPVLDNDKDSDGTFPDSITNVTQPENGDVEVNPDGTVNYTPDTDFVGRDCFTYKICASNSECDSDTATVCVTVGGPVASKFLRDKYC